MALVIGLGYVAPDLRAWLEFVPGLYDHASNLVLSFLLVVVYGLLRLVSGARLGEVVVFGLAIVAANYVYELFLTFANTLDPVDAHYGAAGVAAALIFLAALARHGLRRNPKASRSGEGGVDDGPVAHDGDQALADAEGA